MQVKIGGPEQAPGPHPFHTPVLYPRSIPPWRIRSILLFHTSDLYVMIYIYIWYCIVYMCMYLYIYIIIYNIYTPEYVQSWFYICTRIIWARIHTWVCTCKNRFTMPKPCDCIGKVCACSVCCVMVGMYLAVVSWQSKNELLVTLPPSQPVAGCACTTYNCCPLWHSCDVWW